MKNESHEGILTILPIIATYFVGAMWGWISFMLLVYMSGAAGYKDTSQVNIGISEILQLIISIKGIVLLPAYLGFSVKSTHYGLMISFVTGGIILSGIFIIIRKLLDQFNIGWLLNVVISFLTVSAILGILFAFLL